MAAGLQTQELYKEILREYNLNVGMNPQIRKFLADLKDEKATSEDASRYAAELGGCASKALDRYIAPEYLPDGKLSWGILAGTVDPLMRLVFKSVVEAASKVTRIEDAALGIHIKPISPEYPEERVRALMNSMLIRYETEDEEQPV